MSVPLSGPSARELSHATSATAVAATALRHSTRPLIIAGASRSGTTVLRKILGGHSKIRSLGELHHFDHQEGAQPWDRSRLSSYVALLHHRATCGYAIGYDPAGHLDAASTVCSRLPDGATSGDGYRALLAHLGRSSDWIVDKTPAYVRHLDRVLAELPTALVLVVIRDPRDVLMSEKNWHRTLWAERAELGRGLAVQHLVQYHPILMSQLWRSAARATESRDPARVQVIHFERLLADPVAALQPILSAMGLAFEPAMLEVERRGSSNRPGLRTGVGLDSEVQGHWLSGLTAAELWILRQICLPAMRRHGYDMDPVDLKPLPLARSLTALPPRLVAACLLDPQRGARVARGLTSHLRIQVSRERRSPAAQRWSADELRQVRPSAGVASRPRPTHGVSP